MCEVEVKEVTEMMEMMEVMEVKDAQQLAESSLPFKGRVRVGMGAYVRLNRTPSPPRSSP
jgi:hypothetical protein